jgi:CBS domain-containing protein
MWSKTCIDGAMAKLAREIMTSAPQTCSAETLLNEVANLMVEADCGEIPVVDESNRLIGVITDRDIVCRVVAKGKNPSAVTAAECMTESVVCVKEDATLQDVLGVMEENQIRRVPVVDASGACCGIISQADIALSAGENETGELVREMSKVSGGLTH